MIAIRDRAGPIIDDTPTDVHKFRLARNRQITVAVDHRFALSPLGELTKHQSRERGPSGATKARRRIVLQRQLPDLGVRRFDVHRGLRIGSGLP